MTTHIDPLGVDDGSILSTIRAAVGGAMDVVGSGNQGGAPAPGAPTSRVVSIGGGLVEVQYWDGQQWVFDQIRSAPAGGGGGGGPRGPTQAELDLDARALDIREQSNAIQLQIADADRRLEALALQLDIAQQEKDRAVSLGELEVIKDREARIDRIETDRLQLEHDRFGLDRFGLDQQRLGLQESVLQLDKERFQVEQSQFQQTIGMTMQEFLSNQRLGQQGIAINAAALGINAEDVAAGAVLGAGGLLGSLGADLGDLEFRRDELLSNLAANPRDFVQFNREVGGGTSFLEQLGLGEAVTGQSTRLIGEQTLGPAWDALVASPPQRP